ncbi:MAG: universal stress protein [Cytophagaceae bacterium]
MHILYPFNLNDYTEHHQEILAGLSKQLPLKVSFLHIDIFSDINSTEADKIAQAKSKFIDTIEKVKVSNPSLTYEFIWEQGMPVETIVQTAQQLKVDVILMLSSGKDRPSYQGIHIQSATQSVIEKSTVPVWVYTLKSSFSPIKEIVVAIDIFKYDKEKIKQAISLLSPFNVKIDFLYISGVLGVIQQEKAKEVETEIKSIYSNASLVLLEGEDVNTVLEDYCISKEIDIVVLIKLKKTLIEKLFSGSFTHQISYQSTFPVLVLK